MTQQTLGRKGRPPRAEQPTPGRYSIGVKGITYRFRRTSTGKFQFTSASEQVYVMADVEYARLVLERAYPTKEVA